MATTSTEKRGRIPITVLTGFTGCGKTTLILNLIPQLRKQDPGYKLALIKNEIGDVAVDSQLAQSAEMAATQELLGECICCVNVGQIGTALEELDAKNNPDRIIIETSGSAEPLKLVLEIKRLAEATGRYELDGIVSVIDAENWGGYASKSYTAKLQAKQTDLIVINKWEGLSERDYDLFLDKLGDLDVDTPQVKSDKGWVEKDLLFGFDQKLARNWLEAGKSDHHSHEHADGEKHTSEVECLSVTLKADSSEGVVDLQKLDALLKAAPKDEVYRIKGVVFAESSPKNADGKEVSEGASGRGRYILNWSFGRWTWYSVDDDTSGAPIARLSIFTAPYESTKWSKKASEFVKLADGAEGDLEVKRVQ
ncbi:Putative cobW/HypB/UreG, nucleotide-binding domain-containing protein [Septoria linicola]|uniref:CobW/HypB/UreG, nucleotide-binding domain-containing protein n=1 Tax=Septoria linicola TaxID=215465 RepID=A0A9Q9AY43_9PEZI|nr:Putative cobW/HypB/UreG, nucleotide-binding domain-containing protein [Septoria linicola]